MKTDELISMLATGEASIRCGADAPRLGAAVWWGIAGAAILMFVTIGMRPDIEAAAATPMFWVKVIVPLLAAVAATYMTSRLVRPGAKLGSAPALIMVLLIVVWIFGMMALYNAPGNQRLGMVFRSSWLICIVAIAMLSVPLFISSMLAIRQCAPTRLRLAGGAAGLLAGSVGAALYALHCPETSLPFLSIWYVLGIGIPTAVGAMLGPRVLRW